MQLQTRSKKLETRIKGFTAKTRSAQRKGNWPQIYTDKNLKEIIPLRKARITGKKLEECSPLPGQMAPRTRRREVRKRKRFEILVLRGKKQETMVCTIVHII